MGDDKFFLQFMGLFIFCFILIVIAFAAIGGDYPIVKKLQPTSVSAYESREELKRIAECLEKIERKLP